MVQGIKKRVEKLKPVFAALANEPKLTILLLCNERPHNVTELSKAVKIAYTVTSRYISDMEKVGLVKKTRRDNEVFIESLVTISDKGGIKFR